MNGFAKHIPNALTILRIALALPIGWMVLRGQFGMVLLLFFVAGVTDGLDGYLARKLNAVSRLGAILDPLSDKALMLSSFTTLTIVGAIPLWLTLFVVLRDIVIVVGALAYHHLIGRYEMAPTFWGKLCTFVQILYVLLIVVVQLFPSLSSATLWLSWPLVVVLLTSGVHYVVVWSGKALRGEKLEHHR